MRYTCIQFFWGVVNTYWSWTIIELIWLIGKATYWFNCSSFRKTLHKKLRNPIKWMNEKVALVTLVNNIKMHLSRNPRMLKLLHFRKNLRKKLHFWNYCIFSAGDLRKLLRSHPFATLRGSLTMARDHALRTSFTDFPCEVPKLRLRISFTEFPSTLTEFVYGVANPKLKTLTEMFTGFVT